MHKLLLLLPLVVLIGCRKASDTPKTVSQLRDLAVEARDEAKKDPNVAAEAAQRAEEAAQAAAEIIQRNADATDADKAASEEAAAAARQARLFADLAEEREQLAEITSGWKAAAYWATRKVALAAVFTGLALAADQAAKTDLASLPPGVQSNATLAAELAGQYAGRKPLPNGQPDWEGIASDLREFRSQPPVPMSYLLALALVLSGQSRMALYELEQLDPDSLQSRDQLTEYRVLRGVILSQNDLRHLAVRELETIETLPAENGSQPYGSELLAGIHLLTAYLYLDEGQYRRADVEIVRAMKIWPDNPVSVFLTGERLAATGQYEKAADSLEQISRGTEQEWLAKRIARRARDLRDRKGNAEPLLTDSGFLRDLVIHYVGEAAKESQAARQLNLSIATAKQFGERMLQRLPGVDAGTTQSASQ